MPDISPEAHKEALINYQRMMAEDVIVEIAGKTGTSKRWGEQLKAVEGYNAEDPTPEQNVAMEALHGQFGKFTKLVIETWNAPANVTKRLRSTQT
jgi:hypothetical protein